MDDVRSWRGGWALASAAVLALGVPLPAAATTFLAKSFEELVDEAGEIFVGTVTALVPRRTAAGVIVTDVTFSDRVVLKGDPSVPARVLTVLGGTLDGETVRLAGVPEFQLGVRYLVFARLAEGAAFPVVGGPQGLYQVRADAAGRPVVLDARGGPIRHASVRGALAAAGAPGDPVPLDAFLQAIRQRLERR